MAFTKEFCQRIVGQEQRLRSYFGRHAYGPAEVDDFVQDTFLHALMAGENGKPEAEVSEKLESWIIVIARNLRLDNVRSTNRLKHRELAAERQVALQGFGAAANGATAPDLVAANAEDFARVSKMLRKFQWKTEEHRRAVLLVCLRDLTRHEAAACTGIKAEVIRQAVRRVTKKLQLFLVQGAGARKTRPKQARASRSMLKHYNY